MAPKTPPAVAALLQALRTGDRQAFLAAFAPGTVVYDTPDDDKANINDWSERLFSGAVLARPINTRQTPDGAVVTIVLSNADVTIDGVLQCDWTLSVSRGKISALIVTRSPSPELPGAVARFVEGMNTFNIATVLEAFADDAVVNDQLREYRGKASIKRWADREIIANRMTMYVVKVSLRHCTASVEANVDGDFDKEGLPNPLLLTFYFTFHDDKIVQLIILRNEPDV